MDGDHRRLVAAPEPRLLQGAAGQGRGGPDHCFEMDHLGCVDEIDVGLFGEAQPGQLLEVDDVVDASREPEAIAAAQDVIGTGRSDHLISAADVGEEHALQVAQPGRVHGEAVELPALLDHHGHAELPQLFTAGSPGRAAGGQHGGGQPHDGRQPDQRNGKAELADFEEPEGLLSGRLQQSRYDDVGRRPHQGDHTTEDGGVRERQEVVGRRLVARLGPGLDLGNQHGDDRCVVEERRGRGGGDAHPGDGGPP